jgi:hypothetical protein
MVMAEERGKRKVFSIQFGVFSVPTHKNVRNKNLEIRNIW